ncbi:MAG TPA: F0F1 ATP synthase subunit epsilon, partial [Ornithinimicrobium sp.]|nr:F0F1 ATP synthase subunit epsilon [Ornithinimicrobium sp.]
MSELNVSLVAADRTVWEGEASMVSLRSSEGELGIMP